MPNNSELKKLLLAFRRNVEPAGISRAYSSTDSSKGALLDEAQVLFSHLAKNSSLTLTQQLIISDDIFNKGTYQSRLTIWKKLHSRYFPTYATNSSSRGETTIETYHPLVALFRANASDDLKRGALYYHYALSNLALYELTTEYLFGQYEKGAALITSSDVFEFLRAKTQYHPEIKGWSPQTCRALVSHYLTALRDFGILQGRSRKRIRRPAVDDQVFLYIAIFLRDCGKSPREIVESKDFKLLLLSPQQVENKMADLNKLKKIKFEKSLYAVILDLPWGSLLEFINNLGR
jgi:hypothetical protein